MRCCVRAVWKMIERLREIETGASVASQQFFICVMKMNQVVFLMHDRLRSNFFFSFDKKLHVIRLEIRPGKTSLQFCTRSRVSLPSYPMGVLSGGSVVVSRVAKNKGKIGLE